MGDLFDTSRKIIGLSKEDAINRILKIDGSYQVGAVDGKECYTIDHFRHDRITFEVSGGLVNKAYIF